MRYRLYYVLFFLIILGCTEQVPDFFGSKDLHIRYMGRIDDSSADEVKLVSSASFVEFTFEGNKCEVLLRKLNPPGEHNYVVVEMDGSYVDRIKIENDTLRFYTFEAAGKGSHHLRIFKATEAHTNHVAFGGVKAKQLNDLEPHPDRKIEFIGNSITCAAAADLSLVPCGEGYYHDQHNAYYSYATQAAMELNAQFLLSSVSGIGIYRNWNSLSPVMPDVYENLNFDTDSTARYDFSSYTPDLVSICLGTNDMSRGDGINERLPFDSAIYNQSYVDFIFKLFDKYPKTQICLLSSPMMGGEDRTLLGSCLETIKNRVNSKLDGKRPIQVFDLKIDESPAGCSWHPSVDDHRLMTKRVVPFYKELMGW